MRNNRKLWFLSFVLTLAVLTLSISVFLLYLRVDSIGDEPELPKQTEKQKVKEIIIYVRIILNHVIIYLGINLIKKKNRK